MRSVLSPNSLVYKTLNCAVSRISFWSTTFPLRRFTESDYMRRKRLWRSWINNQRADTRSRRYPDRRRTDHVRIPEVRISPFAPTRRNIDGIVKPRRYQIGRSIHRHSIRESAQRAQSRTPVPRRPGHCLVSRRAHSAPRPARSTAL